MATVAETYSALAAALSRAGVVGDSAEVHGGLCASLCIDGIAGARTWSDNWLADSSTGSGDVGALREHLLRVGHGTWIALNDAELGFAPILPEDDAPLSLRVDALASWCHGFVEGLGLGEIDATELHESGREELEEIVSDFIEISHATVDGSVTDASDFQLAELIEFVRIGTQTVFELLESRRGQRAQHHLH